MRPLVVYLLHFEEPVGRSKHYVGSTLAHALRTRLRRHRAGTGAALTAEAVRRGIGIRLAYVWPASSRDDEKAVKARYRMNNVCPYCRAAAAGHPFPPLMEVPRCDPGVSPISWSQ